MCKVVRNLVWCALFLSLSSPALAQDSVTDPYPWEADTASQQLSADTTTIPAGMGAVFVPRMTQTSIEPGFMLVNGDEVTEGHVGERLVVAPGSYTLIVGSTTPSQSVSIPVTVTEGQTSTVEPTWGGLRIEVVDENLIPHRGDYELIRVDNREVYGVGFGADTLQGESLNTWLVPPGLYRIVQSGESFRARTDFATVYVPEGGFVRYRLVMDEDTGEFRGAGVLIPGEFGSSQEVDSPWSTYLVVGANGSLSQNSNVIGAANQTTLSGDLFAEGYFTYNHDSHHVAGLMEVEEGISQIRPDASDPLPAVKSTDRVRLDALYTYFINDGLGPYVRAAATTQAFGTEVLTTEDITVSRTLSDGTIELEDVAANSTYRISEALQPTIIREGVGLNTRLINRNFLTLSWRAGLGLRQNLYGGAFVEQDDAATEEVEYAQIDSFNQLGIESTIRGVARLTGWVVYATDVELFTDFNTIDQPTVEWDNTLSLRLTDYLSINYNVNLDFVPLVTEDLQLEQSVLMRASWSLF